MRRLSSVCIIYVAFAFGCSGDDDDSSDGGTGGSVGGGVIGSGGSSSDSGAGGGATSGGASSGGASSSGGRGGAGMASGGVVSGGAGGDGPSPAAGAGGGSSKVCGGMLGDTCSPSEFCDYQPGQHCGAADATATCKPRPEACTQQYDPVCGCDGQTHGNACDANASGSGILSAGECK